MSETTEFKANIPPTVQAFLKPDTPKDRKLMAARGLIPMPPNVMTTVFTFFLEDSDEEVSKAAQKSLLEIPMGTLQNILKDPAHPKTLDFFAQEKSNDEKLMEAVLLNKHTTDKTFLFLADKVPERLTTIIMNNHVRLLRTPPIAEAVKKNPHALKSALETMVSFLRMNGIVLEGESAELTSDEIRQILAEPEPEEAPPIPPELIKETKEGEEALTEEKRKTLQQLIQEYNIAQKIKLALKGNKEARSILIKDTNKIVASSVVKSPKITDMEVINICNMRSVQDEVIRIISNKPDWTKNYAVQVALANNPKTPFTTGVRFMRMLRVSDLQKLSKNKNAPPQLVRLAKELYAQKRK